MNQSPSSTASGGPGGKPASEAVFKVVIGGAGGIGRATALLLRELGDLSVDLYLGDRCLETAQEAAHWIRKGTARAQENGGGRVEAFLLPEEGAPDELEGVLRGADILLDCLPGSQAPRMATFARRHQLHYANLTEYVAETREVQGIAEGASTGFLLQTGLAPGVINVLANGLFQRFCRQYEVDTAETIALRVGALTKNALPPHFYGFTWSPIGVATEYVKPATVIRQYEPTTRPSLTGVNRILIEGLAFEEALTSGGAADLPEALAGKVHRLDYKTIRYPGHYAWVQQHLERLPPDLDRETELQRRMEREIPFVEDDLVVVYASVEGATRRGPMARLETSRIIHPTTVGRHTLRAIQATTAAGLAESARLLLRQNLSGVILQSQIDPESYLRGPFVGTVYFER